MEDKYLYKATSRKRRAERAAGRSGCRSALSAKASSQRFLSDEEEQIPKVVRKMIETKSNNED